ncbi:Mis6 domain protein [Calycina marina]|uniref:Mis6 domain protein n=1 Tax=Calycina marina TaxID=1763456 RepID=A0A9P8CJP0_9HELO|nr:Mis6 domain protein [Calycina marina]
MPAQQRTVKISHTVERVCNEAYQHGLQNASLDKLVDIVTLSNQLDQGSKGNLIKNLYPASKVPDAIVVKAVGSLGHGQTKASYSTQAALLKWLVMVHDVLENQLMLSRFYSVLFNLLDTIAIRMELTRQAGNEPPLIGLMRVYKDYYPDVIVGNATLGRASVFKHPNREWRERLGEIQQQNLQRSQDSLGSEKQAFRVTRGDAKSSVVPAVQTSNAQESSTTLEEIEDVDTFIRKLEEIELPNQLISVIGDPLLQKLLRLKSSESTSRRIDNWLLAFFEDQLENQDLDSILEMLASIREYTHFTKVLPPACLAYLNSMLGSWDGITARDTILDLLSYLPIGPYDDLRRATFEAVEEALLDDGTVESKAALMIFYTSLLQHWTTSMLAQSPVPRTNTSTTSDLITHVNDLALTIMQCSPSILVASTVLNFYEAVADLITHPSLLPINRITAPPSELVYTLCFTSSLSTLSRLCNVLAHYKRAYEVAITPNAATSVPQVHSYTNQAVSHFNGFLMDICNCVWRSRAFNKTDPNASGSLIPETLNTALAKYVAGLDTAIKLPAIFGLSYSPALCLLSITHVREMEDSQEENIMARHAGPVTAASLKQLEKDGGLSLQYTDYRMGVLRYIEIRGGSGIGELMYNTMKHLMTARQNMT